MNEHELLLIDRLDVIRKTITKYGEENFYISFSGGKDSTVLHHLVDMALPDNKIPRVYSNTGIEYNDIVKFVKELQEHDDRVVIITPGLNIHNMLETYGYPFKSKEHTIKVGRYKRGSRSMSVMRYKDGWGMKTKFECPHVLKYQYDEGFTLNISDNCCKKLKKQPFHKWEQENNRSITITGMRRAEGGPRYSMNCIVTRAGKIAKFHPLAKVTDEWEQWFIDTYQIKLCRLYYPPFNFERTGCKGCPFSQSLQHDLTVMENLLPAERKQCEIIWKPVYDEYRRIGYRLDKVEQMMLDLGSDSSG